MVPYYNYSKIYPPNPILSTSALTDMLLPVGRVVVPGKGLNLNLRSACSINIKRQRETLDP